MRVAIIGQQAFGASVLEAFLARGDEVAGVFCAPEKAGAKADPLRLEAEKHGLKVFQFASLRGEDAEQALRELNVDIGIMAYVLQFAPQSFVNIPRHGMLQYHPSLLPAYRGPSAIGWSIIKGEKQTGLSIFRPTDGLDEGPVVLQKTVDIGLEDTLGSVYFDKLFPQGVAAMLEAADLVMAGKHQEVVQDESLAGYEGWCKDREAEIHWSQHLDQIHNLIRGCNPAPGAWTLVHGHKVRIYDCTRHVARRFGDVKGKPGEICAIGDASIEITVQGGRLEIHKVRADGAGKISAADFARAEGLAVGDQFASAAPQVSAAESLPKQGSIG
ncbi:MAG TPA: methionyl-tRNA formyltransferase [Hyphomicrobiales bacterium]|nr:methionyl-tRNA formyltransferase [Hyphomicrobiales bacterium]